MAEVVSEQKSNISRKEVDDDSGDIIDYVDLKQLPQFGVLSQQVSAIMKSSSWWEKYGIDLCIHILAFIGLFGSYFMLASSSVPLFIFGILIMGFCHAAITLKAAHMAVHDATSSNHSWNRLTCFLFSDIVGTFSADVGYNIHIKCHHPHTNIIGLGDSSTWRAPFVPSMLYMFVTPLLLPFLTPLVSFKELANEPKYKMARHIILAYSGLALHIYLLMTVSQLSISMALFVIFASRNVLAIPYIHVNVFQHIGLPMYSQKYRPKKIYQMTTGVLNLPRNPILDYCFGHGIISCHTEHHLFPKLSDNMCLKIQPIVQKFCEEHDLPYHKDSYTGRVWHFLVNYDTLMVNAPPVTRFVGLQ